MATHLAGGDISKVPPAHHEVIEWTARQLTGDQRQAVARWPWTDDLDIPELGRTLFCHATPRSDSELFTRLTDEERLGVVFGDVNASVVVCGHTHMQFDRMVGPCRVINAGSVGMPFQSPAGAYWLLLGPDAQLRRTDYDVAAAAAAMRATAYPQLEALAVRASYVLSPPAEEDTLKMSTGAELT